MSAVGIRRYGGPEVLEQVELTTPEPGPGQVRIRVKASAINPADAMLRDGSRLGGTKGWNRRSYPAWT